MPIEDLLESIGRFLVKRARQSRQQKKIQRKKSRKKPIAKKAPRKISKKAPSRKKTVVSRKPAVKKVKRAKKAAAPKARPAPKVSAPKKKKSAKTVKKAPKDARKSKKQLKGSIKSINDGKFRNKVGEITHFFDRISVCVVKVSGPLKVGDRIQIAGRHTDFTQPIKSMQVESVDVKSARKGRGLEDDPPGQAGGCGV